MKKFPNISSIDPGSLDGLNHLGEYIINLQLLSGAIPSNQDGSHDPWDHLEAVMGLSTLGFQSEALKGLDADVKGIVAEAAEYGQQSPEPDLSELYTDVLVES